MFAFIPGVGAQELLLLFVCGAVPLGVGCVVLVVLLTRSRSGRSRVEELEEENRRLRDELRRERERGGG